MRHQDVGQLVSLRRAPPESERALVLRAQALAGRSVGELCAALGALLPPAGTAAKGFVGQLAEAALGADIDAGERPDFVSLGIELKTVPVKALGVTRGDVLLPQESTFVCSISAPVSSTETWQRSRLRARLAAMLLLPVTAAKLAPLPSRRFYAPRLWRPSVEQWGQLRADYEDLMGAIGAGRSMALTAHEGTILQVRPKAANSGVRVVGYCDGGIGAVRPQGFYLRATFLRQVLAAEDVSPL